MNVQHYSDDNGVEETRGCSAPAAAACNDDATVKDERVRQQIPHEEEEEAKNVVEQQLTEDESRDDEILFRQPESTHLGDCPICCLPMSVGRHQYSIMNCCCKILCVGCSSEDYKLRREHRRDHTCPFCRVQLGETNNSNAKRMAAANDVLALQNLGTEHYKKKKYAKALKFLSRAAELGDAESNYYLSLAYRDGNGVEENKKKSISHLKQAAIGGHPSARFHLGCYECAVNKFDRAVKHFIIAANHGHDYSIEALKGCYKAKVISKEDFAAALRAHHGAVNEATSPQREFTSRIVRKKERDKGEVTGSIASFLEGVITGNIQYDSFSAATKKLTV